MHSGDGDTAEVVEASLEDEPHESVTKTAHAEPEVVEQAVHVEPVITEHVVEAEPVKQPEQASVELAHEIVDLTEQVAAADAQPETVSEPEVAAVEEPPLPVALEPLVTLPAGEVTATEQERPTKEGFFARLKRSLIKTKQNLGSGFIGLFRGKKSMTTCSTNSKNNC